MRSSTGGEPGSKLDPRKLREIGAQLRRELDPHEWKALSRLSWISAAGVVVCLAAVVPAVCAAFKIASALVAQLARTASHSTAGTPNWAGVALIVSVAVSLLGAAVFSRTMSRLARRLKSLRSNDQSGLPLNLAIPPWPLLLGLLLRLILRRAPAPAPPSEEAPASPDLTSDLRVPRQLRRQLRFWQRVRSVLQTLIIFPLVVVVFTGAMRWPMVAMFVTGHGNPQQLHEGDARLWTRDSDPVLTLFLVVLFGVLLPCAVALFVSHWRAHGLLAEAQQARRQAAGRRQ